MMKRQFEANSSSIASSSSCRENYSPKNVSKSSKSNNNANNIGCMSGIFHFVYKYNNRRRRYITSGKKHEKNTVSSSSREEKANSNSLTRSSCNVPRSPTLPAEIRLSNSTIKSSEIFPNSTSPAMGLGLDNVHTGLTPESAVEKRRKLLEALQKCDEDLKALKKIIDVVKGTSTVDADNKNSNNNNNGNKCFELINNGELQPSPVSVLDDFNTTPAALIISSYPSRRYTTGRVIHQQKQKQKKKPGEEEITNICFLDRITADSIEAKSHENVASPLWASKAMIESVNEVCRDIAWGEKREIGRIGLALQDRICRDLIEEIVRELECYGIYSLPFEACKRSLRF